MSEVERDLEMEFCFNEWAESFGLNRATTSTLVKEGCNTREILMVLTATAVNKLCLSIGQGIAFRKGLKALGNRVGGRQTDATLNSPIDGGQKRRREDDETSQDSHLPSGQRATKEGLELEAEEELDEFLKDPQAKTATSRRAARTLEGAYGPDPRDNLVIKSQRKKAQRIANFVPESVTKRLATKNKDRMALVQGADGKFSIRSDDDLPAHLTLSEWGAANLRLLQHLLDSGELPRADVEYYNAYTLMIFELVENYEWASILAFDNRYRELQAHTGFPWGTPSRGLEVSTLIPRQRKEKQGDRYKGKSNQRKEKKGTCRAFAREGTCPYGERCIFSHSPNGAEAPKNGPGTDTNKER